MNEPNNTSRIAQFQLTFNGKTIKSVDASSVNVIYITFQDGGRVSLWAEDAISTPYGNIPGIDLRWELAETEPEHDV